MKNLLLASLVLFAVNSRATGLSGGDQYSTVSIEGRLSVSCTGSTTTGPSYGTAYCNSEILNPGEYSYFVGSKVDADSVTLQATWENGKTSKVKTEKYDGVNGKSAKSFNLWISTLLQRPLLNYGKNTVKYSLTKNGSTVEEGTFVVDVVTGAKSVCQRSGYYTSTNNQDCSFPSNLCSRYFAENNYCQ